MIDGGATPVLPPARLEQLGYAVAAYPLALLAAATAAMERTLDGLAEGRLPEDATSFARLRTLAGFDDYVAAEKAYAAAPVPRPRDGTAKP
jgi:2-methylisocitrate lyase-like PEP mutase family enzyme